MTAPSTSLTIAGFTFSGFGVPEKINGGGAQQLAVHKLLGGARVIDALGADDDSIQFEGRFRAADGIDPMTQAAILDQIRRAGKPVQLRYWTQAATVVVRSFTWSFQRFYEVPWKIVCEVVTNAAAAAPQPVVTQDSAIQGGISGAQSAAGGSVAVNTALGPLASAYQQNGPVSGAAPSQVTTIQTAAGATQVSLGNIADASNTGNGVPGVIQTGQAPSAMADQLGTINQQMTDGAAATAAQGYVGGVAVNLGQGH
jgi:hypothetical protein